MITRKKEKWQEDKGKETRESYCGEKGGKKVRKSKGGELEGKQRCRRW